MPLSDSAQEVMKELVSAFTTVCNWHFFEGRDIVISILLGRGGEQDCHTDANPAGNNRAWDGAQLNSSS